MKLYASFNMPWPSIAPFLHDVGEKGFTVDTIGRDYPWHQAPLDIDSGDHQDPPGGFGMIAHGDRYSASRQTFIRGDYSLINPLLIEFDVPDENVRVAAEPLLIPLLRSITEHPEDTVVSGSFGSALQAYIGRAVAAATEEDRIAIALEASADPDIIQGHLANAQEIWIDYFSRFRSMFLVKLPVLPRELATASLADRTSSGFRHRYEVAYTPLADDAEKFAKKYFLSRVRDQDAIF